jgi:predicted HicB family RNase H-like nuclease
MTYLGYTGTVEYDADDEVFHGRVCGLRDVVSYEAASADALESEFRSSVEAYLAHCTETGKKPERPSRIRER